jgi:hypothetical protein
VKVDLLGKNVSNNDKFCLRWNHRTVDKEIVVERKFIAATRRLVKEIMARSLPEHGNAPNLDNSLRRMGDAEGLGLGSEVFLCIPLYELFSHDSILKIQSCALVKYLGGHNLHSQPQFDIKGRRLLCLKFTA